MIDGRAQGLPAPPPLGDGVVAVRLLAPHDAPAIASAVPPGESGGWEAAPGPYSLLRARDLIAAWEEGRRRGERLSLAVLAGPGASAPAGEFLGTVVFETGAPAAKECADVVGQLEGGYWVRPERRGRGYAARALRLASSWALGLGGVVRIWLEIERANLASRRVAERSAFGLCGLRWRPLGGAPPGDVLIYERRA